MSGRSAIFISYRREDAADVAARIHDRLSQAFGNEAVFIDVDRIPIGADFSQHIGSVLSKCRCLLAVIGPSWHASHHVCAEIESALRFGVRVIPVLVNNAEMPAETTLPLSVAPLAKLNASRVRRNPDFHRDMDGLIAALRDDALAGWGHSAAQMSSMPGVAANIWADLSQSCDSADLRRFADQFPGTIEGLEARRRADALASEEAAWLTLRRDSVPSLRSFIASYPVHARRADAEKLLSNLQGRIADTWRRLQKFDDIESLAAFRKEAAGCPEEAFVTQRMDYLRVLAPLERQELSGGALKAILVDASRRSGALQELDRRWTRELQMIEAAIDVNRNSAHEEQLQRLLEGKKEQLRQLSVALSRK